MDINGHIDLSNTSSHSLHNPARYPLHGRKSMSPFWTDLDNRDSGNGGVHYQLYSSDNLPILSDISQAARASGVVDSTYSAKFALVVTWDHVAYFADPARVSSYCVCYIWHSIVMSYIVQCMIHMLHWWWIHAIVACDSTQAEVNSNEKIEFQNILYANLYCQ